MALACIGTTVYAATDTSSLNPWLADMEYSVRGEVLLESLKLKEALAAGEELPFDEIISCNIGNPQALGQKPLSFNREVLSLITNPSLLEHPSVTTMFKEDAIKRAKTYLEQFPLGLGPYTNSQGIAYIRQEVADFIEARDGFPASKDEIFLTDGASAGVRLVMQTLFTSSGNDGVLVPFPQYPLYTALSALFNVQSVPYYLDESNGWELKVSELEARLATALAAGTVVKALVIIAPGNPTGQTLSEENMAALITFCADKGLVLLADEVYQENIYIDNYEFVSFKKVATQMAQSNSAAVATAGKTAEIISFHTISKGFIGECGLRGGYFELYNISPEVKAQMYKLASITLCANTHGQVGVGLMVNRPQPGDASYEIFAEERDGILGALKRRSIKITKALQELEGVTCNPSEGALYAFPQITLPPGAVAAAERAGTAADTFYCLELLRSTGIVTVPGSGFGQVDGTWHFRVTFLPPEAQVDSFIQKLQSFHAFFMDKYKAGKDEL